MNTYHIAQINIGTALAPTDDPIMADFMNNLDRINALAEQAPGFVWRLKDDNNNATSIQVYDDPLMLLNMSVWESIEALHQFTYYTAHTEFLRRRGEWFEKLSTPIMALWWIPTGTVPTALEGKAKVEYLQQHGPTPQAFTFKQRFTVADLVTS